MMNSYFVSVCLVFLLAHPAIAGIKISPFKVRATSFADSSPYEEFEANYALGAVPTTSSVLGYTSGRCVTELNKLELINGILIGKEKVRDPSAVPVEKDLVFYSLHSSEPAPDYFDVLDSEKDKAIYEYLALPDFIPTEPVATEIDGALKVSFFKPSPVDPNMSVQDLELILSMAGVDPSLAIAFFTETTWNNGLRVLNGDLYLKLTQVESNPKTNTSSTFIAYCRYFLKVK